MPLTPVETQDVSNMKDSKSAIAQCSEIKINNNKGYLFIKRAFDIVASLVGGIVLLIPMAILALAICLESPGPAIYSQERLGKNGKGFVMYKFRSMYVDAEKNGPQWAQVNDRRCTSIGRVIRLFHIDELPQLWNILKGDMSFVGPRPERSFFYDEFEKTVPAFRERLRVTPGLTGLSQVNGCYDLTPDERLVYDLEYMEKMSVWFDLKCLFQTVAVVFNHKGAR